MYLILFDKLTLINRAELFTDRQGIITGTPGRYFGYTTGLAWKPKQEFWIRPEIRYDRSLDANTFQGGNRNSRWTVAFDFFLFF